MKKNIFLLAIIMSIGLYNPVIAQTSSQQHSPSLEMANPESQGMSSERLSRIDGMIEKAIADNVIPGAVMLVSKNGKIVYQNSLGLSDVQSERKFDSNDIFRIASQTKAITTTAVMMLWEEGHFFLDDPISKYIPEFKNPQLLDKFNMADSSFTTKPAGKEITIRHLMTHTSGVGYGMIDGDDRFKAMYAKAGIIDAFTKEAIHIEENIKKLAKLPIHHVPGEAFVYSEGLDVLGYLIEIVSGQKFDVYLAEHIFKPLGMKDTYFYLPDGKASRLVQVQAKMDDKWQPLENSLGIDADFPVSGAKTFFSGGGGLSSTIIDYANFLQMYLNGGELNGIRLLSRKTIEFMLSNQVGDLFGTASGGQGFGLGYALLNERGVAKGGKGSLGTFGWGGAFNTQYFADPKEKIIGIILKQTLGIGGDYTGARFQRLIFQALDD